MHLSINQKNTFQSNLASYKFKTQHYNYFPLRLIPIYIKQRINPNKRDCLIIILPMNEFCRVKGYYLLAIFRRPANSMIYPCP